MGGEQQAAGILARLLLEGSGDYRELQQLPLGTLLPGIERIVAGRPADGLGTRATNGLINARLDDWSAIAQVSALELITLPNFGEKSFLELAEALMTRWLEARLEIDERPRDLSATSSGSSIWAGKVRPAVDEDDSAVQDDRPTGPTIRDPQARAILEWLWERQGVSSWAELLERVPDLDEAPEQIRIASTSFGKRSIVEVLDLRPTVESDWLGYLTLDDRQSMVAKERIFAEGTNQKTLSDLAERLEITRERVRQIQKALTTRLLEEAPAQIVHLASRLRRRVGDVTTREELRVAGAELVAASGKPTADEFSFRVEVLVRLAGPWVGRGPLLLSAKATAAVDRATAAVGLLGPGQPADAVVANLSEEIRDGDRHLEELRSILTLRELDGSLYRWGGSQPDKAYTVLSAAGRPLEFFELHAGVGLEASPRSLAQRLREDPRFMRRGKDTFGLREWGGEEYSGILEELEQAIERGGGRVDLGELVDRFTAEFDVSANSVRSYANDRRFLRHEDGTIAMRGVEDEELTPLRVAPLEDTPAVYLLDDVWHLRIEVDHDVLRGSGRPLRRSVAAGADLEPGLGLGFRYDEGVEVSFSWRGTQPTIGSVRGVAMGRGAVEGDLLFLPLSGAEPRPSRLVEGRVLQRESGVRRLAAEIGFDPDVVEEASDEPPSAIRLALGLTHGSDWHDVVDRLRRRREDRLLALVPEVWL